MHTIEEKNYESSLSVFEGCGDILPRNGGWRPAESKTVRDGKHLRGQAVHTDGQRQGGCKSDCQKSKG